jgi:hypothetical protein
LSNFVLQPIDSECRTRNIHPMIMELPAKKSKAERVATLAPLYRRGSMYHNKINCGKLEGQLLGFPRSKLWDVMDGLAYITWIMDKHSIYFDPIEGENEDVPEEEYDDIFNDTMMSIEDMGFVI